MGEPAYQLPEEDRPDIRPDLRGQEERPRLGVIEGGGETSEQDRDRLSAVKDAEEQGLYNDTDQEDNDTNERSSALDRAGKRWGESGLYNSSGDNANLRERLGARVASLKGSVMRHKWLWGLGAGGVSGLLIVIALMFLLLAALKIPHLAENITAYQFARVFQRAAENNERAIGQKIAIESADDSVYKKIKAKYNTGSTQVKEQWSKLDKYRPNKVIQNMESSNQLKFNYKTTVLGREKLVGITMTDRTMLVKSSPLKNLIPGYKLVGDVKLTQQFLPELNASMKANEIGPIVRGLTAKEIRQRLGISLTAWTIAKYKNLTEEKARLREARDAHEKIATNSTDDPKTKALKDGKEEAQQAQKDTIDDDKKLIKALDNGGDMEDVDKTIAKAANPSTFQKALAVANPLYGVAVPVCIVYDGSVDRGGSTINAQSEAQMKSYQYIASAADQEKDGTDASTVPVGALNTRLGDISTSVPMQRATDPTNYSSAAGVSAQASSGGTFSLLNALFGGGAAVSTINAIADHVCPTLTNVGVAVGVTIANIIAGVLTGGGETAAVNGAGSIATRIVERIAASFVERFATKAALKETAGKMTVLLKDSGKSAAKIAGLTVMAKMIVASQSGYLTNGIETNNDLANSADSGGNLMANEVMREQFYGRPLNKNETAVATSEAVAYVAGQNAQKSAYQRYLALSNPNSLLTTTATSISGWMHKSSYSNIVTRLGNIIGSPLSFFGNTIMNSDRRLAYAATDPNSQNYHNIQWGWSKEEVALSKKPAYSMLENVRILAQSGQYDNIKSDYEECFDGDSKQGDLIAEGKIVRDEDGNVDETDGKCSPKNLGIKNKKYGDLVFRWRLAMRDNKNLDTLIDEQEITSDAGVSGGTSLKIATFNVRGASHSAGSEPGKPGATRMENNVDFITSKGFDVIGFQELQLPQRAVVVDRLGSTYDIFPDTPNNINHRVENSIIWNSEKYSKVDGGVITGKYKYFHGQALDEPWVKLEDKETGQQFIVENTHDPADARGPAQVYRANNARQHVVDADAWQKEGLPVFITGDFNSKYSVGNEGSRDNLPYCIMTKSGVLRNAFDILKNKSGACPSENSDLHDYGSFGYVDHIYATKEVQVSSYSAYGGPKSAHDTDHPVIAVDATIPGQSSTGGGADFNISSFNIYFSSDKDHADYSIKKWRERLARSVSVLKKQDIAVAGLQEVRENQWSALQTNADDMLGDGWGIYPSNYKAAGYAAQNPIVWNKSDFTFVSGKTLPGGRLTSPGVQPNSSVLVRLRSNTGQEIYLLNVHEPVHNGTQVLARYQSALEHAKQIKELGADGIPIFVTGDFNSSYTPNSRQSTWQNKKENMAYCILTKDTGLWDALDAERNNTGHCPSTSGPVDHIFLSRSVTVQSGSYDYSIGPPANGSDVHHTLIAHVTIPGSGGDSADSGASKDGWTWPLSKSVYTGLNQCWNNAYNGGHHAGLDIAAGSGTKVLAAHDGTVTSYSYNTYGGNTLIINAGNGLWYNYQHLKLASVHAGETVKAGQPVAISDNSGSSTTGAHLHFGVAVYAGVGSYSDNSKTRNPLNYLPHDRNIAKCQ